MLDDTSIIRNRRKIEACMAIARAIQCIQRDNGSFCLWFYDVQPADDLVASQNALKTTFKFVGPETARMWLMAAGRIRAV